MTRVNISTPDLAGTHYHTHTSTQLLQGRHIEFNPLSANDNYSRWHCDLFYFILFIFYLSILWVGVGGMYFAEKIKLDILVKHLPFL